MKSEHIRFARSRDGTQLAWIACGRGAQTLIYAPNAMTNIVDDWKNPLNRDEIAAYANHFRLIRIDGRGSGNSQRHVAQSVELWADDIEAVADAAGCDAPFVLLGQSSGVYGPIAFAARSPDRLSHLLLYGGKANGAIASRIPEAVEAAEARLSMMRLGWGHDDPIAMAMRFAYLADDMTEAERTYFSGRSALQMGDARDVAARSRAADEADVRPMLASIRVPTLVGHARGDRAIAFELGRKLAQRIPGAAFAEIDGRNHALRTRDGSLAQWLRQVLAFTRLAATSAIRRLSTREQQVLEGVCGGLTNDAIAERLSISEKTVRNHLTQVFDKLGVATRTQAALAARGEGLMP